MLKEFIPFIDKDRYFIIQLFEFLRSQQGKKHSLATIQEILQVSPYKTKTTINEVITLSKRFPRIKVTFEDEFLYAVNLDNALLNQIINLEAHNSLRFKIFLHTSLNIYNQSDSEFQKTIGISPSTYFRLKRAFTQELGLDKINCMHKSEVFARYYIYQVLVYFSFFDYFPTHLQNNKNFIKTKNSIAYGTLLWKLSPSESQRKQFNYFVFVSVLRSKNGHHVPETDDQYLVNFVQKEQILLFIKHLRKDWYMLDKNALLITRYCISFLINTNNLPTSQLDCLENFTDIEEVTNQQVNVIDELFGDSLDKNELVDLKNKLLKANTRFLNPFFKTDLFLTEQQWNYDNFLMNDSIQNFVTEFTNLLQHSQSSDYNMAELNQINKNYYLILLPKLIDHKLNLPFHIVVDFSEGSLLNDYIKGGLNNISGLNIKIDQRITNLTDIYLTDTFNPTFSKHQIIWDALPKQEDWRQLRSFILNLQKHRFSKLDLDDK